MRTTLVEVRTLADHILNLIDVCVGVLNEQSLDYVKVHGHKRCGVGSIPWYFHNYEHGYQHCAGPASNPYKIRHFKRKGRMVHGISQAIAIGHGINRKRTTFVFSKRLAPGWYWLEKGRKREE